MADLVSALLAANRRPKYHEILAQQAGSTAPTPSWGAALARALQGGMAGMIENGEGNSNVAEFDRTNQLQASAPQSAPPTTLVGNNPAALSPQASSAPSLATALAPNAGNAIASIESGGKYDRLGPVTKTGDRAYGKYQVMGANVPQWTKSHLGQEMTAEEFLKNPQAQDAVFNGQFGQYAQKYGNEGAAKAWFAGEKGMNNPNARDQLGTTVAAYAQKFNKALGPQQPPQSLATALQPDEGAALPTKAIEVEGRYTPQQTAQARVAPSIPPEVMARAREVARREGAAAGEAVLAPYRKPVDQFRPLTDPAERAQRGISPEDKNAYQVGADNKAVPINPQPFAVNVNNQGQSEFERTYGEGLGKQALTVLERGNAAGVQKQRVMLAQKMLQDVETGKLTPMQSTVGGYLQALGVDPKIVGIDPKTPMTSEALNAITSELVVGKIGAGGFPANNFSNPDREFLVQGVFKLGDRPGANFIKLEVAKRVADLDERKADAWSEARSQKKSYEEFERGWRKEVGGQNIFGDLIEQAKKIESGATGEPTPFKPAPGWEFSPSRNQYRDKQGNVYDANGNPVK